ncbi:alpha/beta hydrolase [Rhizobium leguminosarum]|uniref:alpha/beta fold hydrolase n=1 Tax=Rhizobium leguminosarum TaxID=384 RepID=UPI0028F41BBD|nr:alpha/beta hydrolase [Rhizobium leguminosarum]
MTSVDQGGWTNRKRRLFLPDGRPMAFVDSGGQGPVLLLLHGYSDSSRSFSLLEPHLEGYRLVIPDLPGHGASAADDGLTVADFADDVAAFLAALSIDRCIVVGHSMGAMIGMELSALLGRKIKALVSISGALRPAFPQGDIVTEAVMGFSDPIDPTDPFFNLWHACPHPVDTTFLTFLRHEAAAIPSTIWQGILREFTSLDLTDTAKSISTPVLCIAGSADTLFHARYRNDLTSALSQPQIVLLEGFGHNPHWENPSHVALCIERFARTGTVESSIGDA